MSTLGSLSELSKKRERSEHWDREETVALINLYQNHREEFRDPKSKPKQIWETIADQMLDSGYARNREHCRNRWKVLCRDYKKAQDNFGLKKFKYYQEMANALQYNSPELAVNMGLVMDGQGVDPVLGASTSASASNPISISLGLNEAHSPRMSLENKKRERSEHWHRNETIALINFYKSHKADGGKPKKKPRDLWEAIASQMQDAGYLRNQEHCRNRWKVLCRDFKNSKDTGELESGKKYKYFDDMSSALEVHFGHQHIEPTPAILSPSPPLPPSVKYGSSIVELHEKNDLLTSNYLMSTSSPIQSPASLASNKTKVGLIYEGRRVPQKLVIYPNSSSVDLESTIRTLCRIPGNKGILLLDDEGDAVPISNILPNGEVFTVAVLDDSRYRGELTLDNPHPNDLIMYKSSDLLF
ncbi:hypothetical protein K493DRAFT_57103 [Basidiobolus meristosporus CBS 931.73]|uniref:Myb-like domain-containing protein n=1 Tax=Basidiobolus meristosporus CBS 931.73 TaxID=1314790 RepID=A0A1Y1XYF7_9FUNG|nr:hypothetical protein K493DRAFT_57103 [Basidiobolus meristosporus CBS 931.73]|eukprot:ORX90695.1 hypothetical protein K493DRAFT_57103 [Basidiobolus meristosporus CBS 931.73]